ncbi:unnamed protein product [Amoebophrya sp. A120]|nr:unnamed protein product [Amoebophrya sp. A120]|eukprot:GSA120T00004114001.1
MHPIVRPSQFCAPALGARRLDLVDLHATVTGIMRILPEAEAEAKLHTALGQDASGDGSRYHRVLRLVYGRISRELLSAFARDSDAPHFHAHMQEASRRGVKNRCDEPRLIRNRILAPSKMKVALQEVSQTDVGTCGGIDDGLPENRQRADETSDEEALSSFPEERSSLAQLDHFPKIDTRSDEDKLVCQAVRDLSRLLVRGTKKPGNNIKDDTGGGREIKADGCLLHSAEENLSELRSTLGEIARKSQTLLERRTRCYPSFSPAVDFEDEVADLEWRSFSYY